MNLFQKMGRKYPELNNLSAKRFSQLTRKELFLIAKTVKTESKQTYIEYFYKYPTRDSVQLAHNAYCWAKDTL